MKTKEEQKQINDDELKKVTGGVGVVGSGENKGLDPDEKADEERLENLTDNVGADKD